MQRLSNKFIEKLSSTTEKIYWDSAIRGFGIRISPSGRKSFIVNWRNNEGRQGRKVIGVHGKITTEQARQLAQKYFYQISQGEEPRRNAQANPTFS